MVAGSLANQSNSHNVATFLNPNPAGSSGRRSRYFLFANSITTPVIIHGVQVSAALPPPNPVAWMTPPGVLNTPIVNPLLPLDVRTRYITFADPPVTPTPWFGPSGAIPGGQPVYKPFWTLTQVNLTFLRLQVLDDEAQAGSGAPSYFACQALVHQGDVGMTPVGYSNLYYEYR